MTMTNREFYTAIIKASVSEDITAKAKEELAKLDVRNAKRSEAKATKNAEAFAPIEEAILKALDYETPKVTSEIATAIDVSTAKVSPRCKALVESGKVVEVDVKTKNGMRKGYYLAR